LIEDIERIAKQQSPYSEIHKLPELIGQFRNRFAQLLEDECEPIRRSIKEDHEITIADLNHRSFKDTFTEKVHTDFDALLDRLSHVSNIYEAVAMQTESDRMKQRFIQSFNDEELLLVAEATNTDDYKSPPSVRKTKTVSVKSLFSGTKQINNMDDIDRLLNELRTKLESQLEDDTTIQII